MGWRAFEPGAIVTGWAGELLPPLILAQRAFIKVESLALPAADMVVDFFGTGAEIFCAVGADFWPAFILAQRALAKTEILALAAADMPELEATFVAEPFDPNREESSASSFVICSLS